MTRPTALAREVLEAQDAFDRDAEDAAHYGEVCDRLNEVVDRAAPALARTVIAAADLVDELREAADKSHRYCKDDARDAYQDAADRITAALNGENA